MTAQQPETLPELIERMRGLHVDHVPDGWPAVRMREISALLDRIAELEAQLARKVPTKEELADYLLQKDAVIIARKTYEAMRWPSPPWNQPT